MKKMMVLVALMASLCLPAAVTAADTGAGHRPSAPGNVGTYRVYIAYSGPPEGGPPAVGPLPGTACRDTEIQVDRGVFYYSGTVEAGGTLRADIGDTAVFYTFPRRLQP